MPLSRFQEHFPGEHLIVGYGYGNTTDIGRVHWAASNEASLSRLHSNGKFVGINLIDPIPRRSSSTIAFAQAMCPSGPTP